MGRLTEDLRFFIGSFFLMVGVLLSFQGWREPTLIEGYNLNLITGAAFVVFSVIALALAVRARE